VSPPGCLAWDAQGIGRGDPLPVTCASSEPLWLGRARGMGEVLLDTVNLISLFKKNKRQIEKQYVSVKTTLVLDNS